MAVTVFCNVAACGHSNTLNLEKLRDRFGPDAPAMEWDLRPKLKCEADVGLIYAPDSSKVSGSGPEPLFENEGRMTGRQTFSRSVTLLKIPLRRNWTRQVVQSSKGAGCGRLCHIAAGLMARAGAAEIACLFLLKDRFRRSYTNPRCAIAFVGRHAMDNVVPFRNVSARVEVAEVSGEWVVRVTENDQELTRSFEVEEYALSYAEGQRMRLGLNKFVRL
ncbi:MULTISPECIES: hypothetical protein [unclassified Mesorhizobium]|uniref:hypothetical protein n=1 Tax=unclassified Mesorhizobium TaxID=325217 RepID=UPI001FED95DE|nr:MULTISPECIES: hypothetical protein [unclassified Mesorhizobium]